MAHYYRIKNGIREESTCETLHLENGQWVCNPSVSLINSEGWIENRTESQHDVLYAEPSREELIQQEIRLRYSETDEWKINRKMNDALNPDSRMTDEQKAQAREEFAEYNDYINEILARY